MLSLRSLWQSSILVFVILATLSGLISPLTLLAAPLPTNSVEVFLWDKKVTLKDNSADTYTATFGYDIAKPLPNKTYY
jgi:hypothetical protein